MTTEFKTRIIDAINGNRKNFPSDAKQAISLGIKPAQLSRIKQGEFEAVLSDANWIAIARKLDVQMHEAARWITANTPVFDYITDQLSFCKNNSVSRMLCDRAGIGKTHSAKVFAANNANTVYIDCSQVKSKQKLIRNIAKEFGVGSTGRYADVYADLVFYMQNMTEALVILDEAGDLDYAAFLELKALWNATEGLAAWYLMGADGLKAKMETHISHKKVGYAEMFDRFGTRYQKASPDGKEDFDQFNRTQIQMVAKVNQYNGDFNRLYVSTAGSLRRLRTELQKTKIVA